MDGTLHSLRPSHTVLTLAKTSGTEQASTKPADVAGQVNSSERPKEALMMRTDPEEHERVAVSPLHEVCVGLAVDVNVVHTPL